MSCGDFVWAFSVDFGGGHLAGRSRGNLTRLLAQVRLRLKADLQMDLTFVHRMEQRFVPDSLY